MSLTAEEIRQQFAPTQCEAIPLVSPVPVVTQSVTIDQVVEMVTEEVTIRPIVALAVDDEGNAHELPNRPTTHIAVADHAWTWRELRDYVCGQIESMFGVFPRDDRKESGIFKSFLSRHPGDAAAIARYAFEVKGGYWRGAPVSVTRFCRGSDPFFADPIKEFLTNVR